MYSDGSSNACAFRTRLDRFCVICTTTFWRSRSLGTVSAFDKKYLSFSAWSRFNRSMTFIVRSHNAWPIGSKKM